MTNITEETLSASEFVYLTASTDTVFYYYMEFTPKLGVLVSFEYDQFKVYLRIPRNSKPIPLPGIKYMEDIENLADYLGYLEEWKE